MKSLWCAAVAAVTLSLSMGAVANAADIAALPYKARAAEARGTPLPYVNWTGCYVGAGGGYGMYNEETALVTVRALPGIPAGTNFVDGLTQGGRGWLATAQVGCDYQWGSNFVVGAFADADWTNMKGRHTGGNVNIGLQDGQEKLRWDWSAGGRIGYIVRPQLLAYVSGGYTQASMSAVSYNSNLFPAAGLSSGLQLPSRTYHGWFIGAGAEYALLWLPGLFWKNEFRFANYGTRTDTVTCTTAALCGVVGPTAFGERTHLYVETFRTELVWKFSSAGLLSARY